MNGSGELWDKWPSGLVYAFASTGSKISDVMSFILIRTSLYIHQNGMYSLPFLSY